jgi:lipopolysaccharide transport system permease protein
MKQATEDYWTLIIRPHSRLLDFRFGELWQYRYLVKLFVRRDFVSTYKQTILGPLWFFIQPIISSLTFSFIFGNIAGLDTDGLPMMVFYMSGIICWSYFSDCLNRTSSTFTSNAAIFGKVYFPRLIVPVSGVISNLIRLFIQFILLILVMTYYKLTGANIQPNWTILLTPFFILLMAGLGLGLGVIISSFTTKYRDFTFLIGFAVQLLMYASPVIFPLNDVKDPLYRTILEYNPMTPIIEGFRYAYMGAGTFSIGLILYSTMFTIGVMVIGTVIFNKVEKSFMDTV